MSGETEKDVSGWTVDTLRDHMQLQINNLKATLLERSASQTVAVETLKEFFQRQLDDKWKSLDERYATQTKAVDKAFEAQQTSMTTAFTAADRAVSKAMEATEKAVTKAESAAEKRFEAVNEFRGQLTDQAATFLSRTEAEVRMNALSDKLAAGLESLTEKLNTGLSGASGRTNELELRLTSRLDLTAGQAKGVTVRTNDGRAGTANLVSVVSVIIAFVSVVAAILVAVLHSGPK